MPIIDSNSFSTHLPGSRPNILSSKPVRGYTLVELCVAVAIVGILISLAAPSIGAFRTQMQLKTVTESIFNSLNFTRREAIMRNMQVVMCKSSDGRQCVESGGWEQGWIVFQDANSDRQVDSFQDVLLRQVAAPSVKIVTKKPNTNAASPVANAVSYNGMGISFNNGSFTVCTPSASLRQQRAVVIRSGRPRVETPAVQACA